MAGRLKELEQKVGRFPASPGVYLIKDASGQVIYVGKAKLLRQRVRYYLAETGMPPRIRVLQSHMADIEYLVTDNEAEALVLECNLIKEHYPRYNVNLKDDKDYPYLMLTAEPYPRLLMLRLTQRRGYSPVTGKERWFGPFTRAGSVRDTLRLLGKIFPLRRCRQSLTGEPTSGRPCLNYQMGRCLAPCRGEKDVPLQEYGQMVEQIALFLEGRTRSLEEALTRQMEEASQQRAFERAARLRDQLRALREVVTQEQKVLVREGPDQDVLALVSREERAAVHLFKIREGKLLSQEHFPLTGTAGLGEPEVLAGFMKSYYGRVERPPDEILLSSRPADEELLQQWLQSRKKKGKVALKHPRRGKRRELLELARRNGRLALEEQLRSSRRREEEPLRELARLVGLEEGPRRIEGYDISHLQGKEAVGAMVVFEKGRPRREHYRRFLLREAKPGDDYAALQEVLGRRLAREDWPEPNLLLIDGGKGQLSAAREVLNRAGKERLTLLALAEGTEHLFLEGADAPVVLPAHSPLLQLVQRVRDEAHRFALAYHRRRRLTRNRRSQLEEIPGIGPRRRAALLDHFGNINRLWQSTPEEIEKVPGFSKKLASRVYKFLHGEVQN
ncbi:MAG: excinuclease ABC subunit UvrC [Firmicutes bacterium]|nr:excinuclease ABC subunit UvrC [Bacillota bacterium]